MKPRKKSIVNLKENENRVNDLKTFESIPTLLLSNRLMKAWNREIYDLVALAKVNSSENMTVMKIINHTILNCRRYYLH